MKSILKILVLAAVPILAVTMVADQGLAADKGSQLIFQSKLSPDHRSFISIANANDSQAATVLVQFYNDAMEMVLWYLRVLPADSNVLVDPFDHAIPGQDPVTNTGAFIMGTGKANSGHFVIAVTAVGANHADRYDGTPTLTVDGDTVAADPATTANILFPAFLVGDMHGVDNIDAMGNVTVGGESVVRYATASVGDGDAATDGDQSTRNVGDLNVDNAVPVAFNHLTGHFTEALTSTPDGGTDQTASWGGTPIVRPAVSNTANAAMIETEYQTLTGADATTGTVANDTGGRLAEKDAAGSEVAIENTVSGYTNEGGNMAGDDDPAPTNGGGKIDNTADGSPRTQRGLNDGTLVLPALHGGGDMAHQIMLFLSAADEFGGPGKYELIAAKTGYMVSLMDGMGDALPNPAAQSGPVFGGADEPETPPGTKIIVDGIRVWTDAGDCNEDAKGTLNEEGMLMGPWMLSSLTSIVPTALSGTGDFDGLDTMIEPMNNGSPGSIKFQRTGLECMHDFGDGDIATVTLNDDADGVPSKDERTFTAGTLVIEEEQTDRAFVTTGRALLKFLTPGSTFAASWTLKSPVSPAN